MPQSEIYLDAKRYEALVAAIIGAAQEPNPVKGAALDPDQIKIALGEVADIWPESIAGDLALNDRERDDRAEMLAGVEELLVELDHM